MYENHKLCADLTPSEFCLVVEQYKEGVYIRKFHEHVPKSRLSQDAQTNLLRALVPILRCYLNKRGKTPAANRIRFETTYPEPGVLRRYFGTDTIAWSDQVIVPEKFRAAD